MRSSPFATGTRRLARDERGSMAIEMAIVAPILILLAFGTMDVSRMISRQQELQAGVAEAEGIALAANSGASTDIDTLKSVLMQSLHLPANQVSIVKQFRCNTDQTLVSSANSCSSNAVVSTYLKITLTDSYDPLWRNITPFGTWNYRVERTVQLS